MSLFVSVVKARKWFTHRVRSCSLECLFGGGNMATVAWRRVQNGLCGMCVGLVGSAVCVGLFASGPVQLSGWPAVVVAAQSGR